MSNYGVCTLGSVWIDRVLEEPKPNEIVFMELDKVSPLRGCYKSISSTQDISFVISMFETLGIKFNDELIEDLCRTILQRPFRNLRERDAIFMGVDHKDRLMLCNANYVSNISGLHLLSDTFSERSIKNRPNSVFICETVEIAKEFLTKAENFGYKRIDGSNWIDEQGNFTYIGEKTCYDLERGNVMTIQEAKDAYINMYYSQLVMYDFTESLFRFRLPEGAIRPEELQRNRIYVQMFKDRNSQNMRMIKFSGDIRECQNMVDRDGIFYSHSIYLDPSNINEYYLRPTPEQMATWRRGIAESNEYLARVRRNEREQYMRTREEKLKKKRNNINTYNKDVETQLISGSFHKMLTRALDNKVARCLLKLNRLGYLSGSTRNITIRRSDKMMTYMPSGKPTQLTNDGAWVAKGRQNGKYGKVIRKILNEQVPRLKFTDHEIEQLVNHIKAEAEDGSFKVVSGEDIRYWYDVDNYWEDEDEIGTLGSSCMRDSECGKFLDIYCKNPDKVEMVILTKENYLIGRAILWEGKWMDRVYGTDATIKAFKTFAKEKGYHCKSSQNSDAQEGWINPETGESYSESVVIDLETDFDYYPYADTLCYIDVANNQVSNDYRSLERYAEMRDTGGSLDGEDTVYDEYDDRNIHSDEAVYIESRGYYTHVDNAFECEINGCWYLRDEQVSTWDDRYVHEDNVEYVNGHYADSSEIYTCEQDGLQYIEGVNSSVHLPELDITVMEDNVEDAYHDNGYEYSDDGCWSLSDTETETV